MKTLNTRKLFSLLFTVTLVFIIAMLLSLLSGWSVTIRIAAFGLCAAIAVLFVLRELQKDRASMPPARSATPSFDGTEGALGDEMLAAVNVMVASRLKEIDSVIARGGEGLEEMGEVESRVRQAREFSLSSAIAKTPELILDRDLLLKVALNRAWRILKVHAGAALQWIDEEKGTARIQVVEGEDVPADFVREMTLDSMSVSTLRDASLMVWKDAGAVAGILADARQRIGVPVRIGDYRWGWFLLEARETREITATETRFLVALGRETAAALAAIEDWKAAREELRSVFVRLGDHLAARRNRKAGRGGRVAALFESAAKQIGMTSIEIETGKLSAFLMDLGEIGVPELILEKAGALSPQETRFVRDHPGISVKLLRELLLLEPLEHVIIAHHETWNGNGYPTGLKKDEIPRTARLLAVCDAVEAMISDRPYRDAYDAGEAITEVKKHAGSQFDPAMVDVVQKVYEPWINWVLAK